MSFTFSFPAFPRATLRRPRTSVCTEPYPAIKRGYNRASVATILKESLESRKSLVVLVSTPHIDTIQHQLATWLRSQAFDASFSSAVPLSFEPPLILLFYTSSLPARVLGSISIQLTHSILPTRTQLTVQSVGRVPGERRVLRNLVSFLDLNHGVTVLYKPRNLRLRMPRANHNDFMLVERVEDSADVYRWAERLQFAADGYAYAPLSIEFRSNGVDIEVRRGDGSACSTVCVDLRTNRDGGFSVVANVVGERSPSSRRVLQSLRKAISNLKGDSNCRDAR